MGQVPILKEPLSWRTPGPDWPGLGRVPMSAAGHVLIVREEWLAPSNTISAPLPEEGRVDCGNRTYKFSITLSFLTESTSCLSFFGPKLNSFPFKHKHLCFLSLPEQDNYTQVHVGKKELFQTKPPHSGQLLPMDLRLHLPGQSFHQPHR